MPQRWKYITHHCRSQ